jgi:hypothetical protein
MLDTTNEHAHSGTLNRGGPMKFQLTVNHPGVLATGTEAVA